LPHGGLHSLALPRQIVSMVEHPPSAGSRPVHDGTSAQYTEITAHERISRGPAAGSAEPTEILYVDTRRRTREIAILTAAVTIAASLIAATWLVTRRSSEAVQGGLVILSTPAGAEVLIDSVSLGQTPFSSSNLEGGLHSVAVKRPGYQPINTAVQIVPSKVVELRYALVPQTMGPP
jgi:hypothetical protein